MCDFLLVGNKAELEEDSLQEAFAGVGNVLFISAKQGLHLNTLKQRLVHVVLQNKAALEGVVVTNARHYGALLQVHQALKDVAEGLANHIPGDLLALDIRRCLQFLGEITGEITNEERPTFI